MNARIIVDTLVCENIPLMAAWNKLHASIFYRSFLKWNPDANLMVIEGTVPVGSILMPRCLRTSMCRFKNGVKKTAFWC